MGGHGALQSAEHAFRAGGDFGSNGDGSHAAFLCLGAHKDARTPQNLYPIKGLEDELRRRLGDAQFLYRSIKAASQG